MSNTRPQSDLYREAALRHADLDAAARLLEETKSAVFSQKVMAIIRDFPGHAVSKAELQVRASDEWEQFVDRLVRARTAANKAKVELEYQRMIFWEKSQDRADERYAARM